MTDSVGLFQVVLSVFKYLKDLIISFIIYYTLLPVSMFPKLKQLNKFSVKIHDTTIL